MKKIRNIVCLLLLVVTIGTLFACDSGSVEKTQSTDDKVRRAVTVRGEIEYLGSTIGDNEIKRSEAYITNVKKISDTKYIVSGSMIMTDIYGTKWKNSFDCEVTSTDGEDWDAGPFEYTNKSWKKD